MLLSDMVVSVLVTNNNYTLYFVLIISFIPQILMQTNAWLLWSVKKKKVPVGSLITCVFVLLFVFI